MSARRATIFDVYARALARPLQLVPLLFYSFERADLLQRGEESEQ